MFGERNILALLLTLCLLAVSVLPGWAEETPGAAIPDAYEKIAENSRFNLYLRRDTLALIVESKATGKVMYSTVQNPEDMKDNAAWKGQKAVSSLGRVVGFERKTNLPAKRLLKELGIKDTDKEVKARIVVWYQNKQSDLLFSQT